ncbi:UPF0182 family protein [Desulfobacter latus]|uniref:UPF0182 family protein n=1 Tax=Desulfobacter latus TaxID=2292 RepID=A0A850SX19_9BACT|nr:UPF0182 family protein [Desulfobacter latus]NWH04690.1 UPF0182 family protein [Desulfobacter latus]
MALFIIGLLAILGILAATVNFIFLDFFVDLWWFQAQGMTSYYLLRILYPYLIFIFFTILFFAIFYINFRVASHIIGFEDKPEGYKEKKWLKHLNHALRNMYLLLSFVMALIVAIPVFKNWENSLLFLFGSHSGVLDPLFGKDIGFYLFSLPIYNLLQKEILIVVTLMLAGVLFIYWYEKAATPIEYRIKSHKAHWHTSILVIFIFAILCWGFMLERYDLLYETVNLPVFKGPGFVEMTVILPFIWATVVSLMLTGIFLVLKINRRVGWKMPIIFFLIFIIAFLGKDIETFGDTVRKYIVMPNQMVREKDYIKASVDATLAAYGLDKVETRDFETTSAVSFDADDPDTLRRLRNVPVWDREILGSVFEELQSIRTYYSFPTIDVDRYWVDGEYRQVYLGAREINNSKLPEVAQNWINMHLQYTHGQGVAMIPAAKAGDEPMTWFIKDIPPRSQFGLSNDQTDIYYGLADKPYAIVPNNVGEIGSSTGEGEKIVHYNGTGGITINSLWRKFLLANYFKDRDIFFTTKTNNQSRILFRRNIIERILHITPFLKLDQDPYIVHTPKGLFWIQDAYTTASNYPIAPPYNEEGFNYIRNSVKIVIDAYNGNVSYYIADPGDPIINAYRKMYPGIFQPISEMPTILKQHIRYPRDIFTIQMSIYATYHQTNPERFFRQEDNWMFSKIAIGQEFFPATPYYLTLDLIEPGKDEFFLFLPLSPFGRDNLRALMFAGNDLENYGKIYAYRFPRNQQVYGPAQVHSLVNQDTVISEQFSLWDQRGSELVFGKMIIEPTGGAPLYIQPLYLQEEGPLKIPQIKRLIMSLEDAVVMAPSLEEAAVKLEQELRRKSDRLEKRLPASPPTQIQEIPADDIKEEKEEEEETKQLTKEKT